MFPGNKSLEIRKDKWKQKSKINETKKNFSSLYKCREKTLIQKQIKKNDVGKRHKIKHQRTVGRKKERETLTCNHKLASPFRIFLKWQVFDSNFFRRS